jgi:hypothetical protein
MWPSGIERSIGKFDPAREAAGWIDTHQGSEWKKSELYLTQGDALEKLRTGELDVTIRSCPALVPAYANSNLNRD